MWIYVWLLCCSPLCGIGVRETVRVRESDERNASPRSYYFLSWQGVLESGRDRKRQRENNERYASPCSQRKSDEKILRLATVSVERDRVNSEKNASPRSERERGGEQREVCLALFPTKATRSYFAPLPLDKRESEWREVWFASFT